MKKEKETLSVVILNYKDVGLTQRCVQALLEAGNQAQLLLDVIVVDNSGPETGEALESLFDDPQVRVVINERNLGFAAANNQGLLLSRGDFLLLLNNDAFVTARALRAGMTCLNSHPDVAIWAPQLVGEDGRPQVSVAALPTLGQLVGEYWFLGLIWRKIRSRIQQGSVREKKSPQTVESVVGAFFLMPRSVLSRVGLLDTDFFFTVEDVDYCFRVRQQGLRIVYDPSCQIVHIGGASQDHGRWSRDPYLHDHRLKYFRKHKQDIFPAAALVIKTGLWLRRVMFGGRL